jgi:hypothetical protein
MSLKDTSGRPSQRAYLARISARRSPAHLTCAHSIHHRSGCQVGVAPSNRALASGDIGEHWPTIDCASPENEREVYRTLAGGIE